MEGQAVSPPHMDPSRPSIGFPLGTALLLIVIFSLSGIFSCCYHWEKLKSLRQSSSQDFDLEADDVPSPSSKPNLSVSDLKQKQCQSMSVLMPGDQLPKFVALPCPREREREWPEKLEVKVEKPPKPPRMVVPLYYQ